MRIDEQTRQIRLQSAMEAAAAFVRLANKHITAGATDNALNDLAQARAAHDQVASLLDGHDDSSSEEVRQRLGVVEENISLIWERIEARLT